MAKKIHEEDGREDIKGIKLWNVNFALLVVEVILFVLLAWGTVKVSNGYTQLIEATDDYMVSQEEIYQLERGYDSLTRLVRAYAVTRDFQYAESYFEEMEEISSGQEMKAAFTKFFGLKGREISDKLEEVSAMESEIMQKDFHCIKLVAVSTGVADDKLPAEIAAYELTDEEKRYTLQQKQDAAFDLIYDRSYEITQGMIQSDLDDVRVWVSDHTTGQQMDSKDMLDRAFHRQRLLMTALLLFMVCMFLIVMFMIVKPIYKLIKSIREETILEPKGPYEFRYLATTYNDICRINTASKLELNQQANYDALTGVLNRGSFNRLCKLFKGSLQPMAFLMIDVDVFKSINDNYGHEVGDEALKKVARLLKSSFRDNDYPVRYGGDEFVMIVTGATPAEKQVIGDKIDSINHMLLNPSEENMPKFSLSVGVAFSPKGYSDEIFQKADKALYFTKENGRCGYTFYQEKMFKNSST